MDKHRVKVLPGCRTGDDPSLMNFVRLSFSYYQPQDVGPAVLRLRDAVMTVRAMVSA